MLSVYYAEKISALSIFTFLWSHIAMLQVFKAFYTVNFSQISVHVLITIALSGSIIFALFCPWRSSSLITLGCTHFLSLVLLGSQSNHVIVGLTVTALILLSYSNDRSIWQQRLSGNIFSVMVILYAVPCLHKLNTAFLDPSVSCASLYMSGFLSMWLEVPPLGSTPHLLCQTCLDSAPYQAVFIETSLPLLLLGWRWSWSHGSLSKLCHHLFIVIGVCFHVLLCLPLPPMSVYPFSMAMAPMYILLLSQSSVTRLYHTLSNGWVMSGVCGLTCVLFQVSVTLVLAGQPMPPEYPPYGLWPICVVWNVVIWGLILHSALSVSGSPSERNEMEKEKGTTPRFDWTSLGVCVSGCLVVLGMGPYLGLRTYPALAMFSNLRSEGSSSNHLISLLAHTQLMSYQSQYVTIHNTSLSSLQHFQVDLGQHFPARTRRFNDAFGVSNQFWITPPPGAWMPPEDTVPLPFTPFSVPLLELRKRVSQQISSQKSSVSQSHFYVNFTLHHGSKKLNSQEQTVEKEETLLFDSSQSYEAGQSPDIYLLLKEPVSWIEREFFRFRSFDNSYSPCRH